MGRSSVWPARPVDTVPPAALGAAGQPDPKQVLTPKGSRMAKQAGVEERVQMPLKWGWLLGLGIVLILVGMFSVAVSVVATIASVLLFGWLLLFTGAMEAVWAFHQSKWTGILLHVVNGALSVVAGFLLVKHQSGRRGPRRDAAHGHVLHDRGPLPDHHPHRDSSAAPGLAAPERRRDAVARRLHLAAVARGRRLGDRDARRDRHDLHRLVVGDRHDSPEIGGLDPALVPELCRAPEQPDLEDQRRMDQASVALASILTAWPVLSEFDKPDATKRYATVPLSPEAVERIAVECSKALLHSRGGPDGARGVGEHGGPPRHRAWRRTARRGRRLVRSCSSIRRIPLPELSPPCCKDRDGGAYVAGEGVLTLRR